ncbi:hypothetical protein G9A89_008911 [Geosiphon pyriformis]|nr:hypothetical protein G9A89_008911 [Geosiphon pyriformis]
MEKKKVPPGNEKVSSFCAWLFIIVTIIIFFESIFTSFASRVVYLKKLTTQAKYKLPTVASEKLIPFVAATLLQRKKALDQHICT